MEGRYLLLKCLLACPTNQYQYINCDIIGRYDRSYSCNSLSLQKNQQMQAENKILGIALVICRHPVTKKYLAVHQKNKSWWVAGGRVDAPEAFTTGAIRECVEEAGIDVELKGILRIEQSPSYQFSRLKIIFYAEPKNVDQVPKQKPDSQSLGAAYYSIQEILALKPLWRGPQLYGWAKYLQDGGRIHPLSVLREIDVAK